MHMWTGLCQQVCGMSLKDKNNYFDLTGMGKIRWLTKQGGFHQTHAIVKLADGSWWIAEHAGGKRCSTTPFPSSRSPKSGGCRSIR